MSIYAVPDDFRKEMWKARRSEIPEPRIACAVTGTAVTRPNRSITFLMSYIFLEKLICRHNYNVNFSAPSLFKWLNSSLSVHEFIELTLSTY